jgi:hypothetical protein
MKEMEIMIFLPLSGENLYSFFFKGRLFRPSPFKGAFLFLPLQGGGREGDGSPGIKRRKFSTIRLPQVVKIDSG